MEKVILVLNAGSSSLKFLVFALPAADEMRFLAIRQSLPLPHTEIDHEHDARGYSRITSKPATHARSHPPVDSRTLRRPAPAGLQRRAAGYFGLQGRAIFWIGSVFTLGALLPLAVVRAPAGDATDLPNHSATAHRLTPLRERLFRQGVVIALVGGMMEAAVSGLFALFAQGRGMTIDLTADLLAVFGLGGLLMQYGVGWLADHRGVGTAALSCAAGTALVSVAHLMKKVIRVEVPGEVDRLRELEREVKRLKEALGEAHLDLQLGEEYLRIACRRAGVEDVEEFKKKHGGKR